jgi:hypothetical protein
MPSDAGRGFGPAFAVSARLSRAAWVERRMMPA